MFAVRSPPIQYTILKVLDLASRPVVILLNLAAIPLVPIFYLFFDLLRSMILPDHAFSLLTVSETLTFSLWQLLVIILGLILMVIIHELIHGLFFWIYTHERPVFAFKTAYAFAAAPEWYIRRNAYFLIGLAPLIMISVILVPLATLLPPSSAAVVLLIAAMNAAGSLGDIVVVTWILFHPADSYIQDHGDRFYLFLPTH